MFEWALQDDINRLKYASAICWNENDTLLETSTSSNLEIFCFCELTNSQSMKPSFPLLVKQVSLLELFDRV